MKLIDERLKILLKDQKKSLVESARLSIHMCLVEHIANWLRKLVRNS